MPQVRAVLDDYLARPADDFGVAEFGFALDGAEQRRRWLLQSLLHAEGLRPGGLRRPGSATAGRRLPASWAGSSPGAGPAPTGCGSPPAGLARSDAIGPWLYSPAARSADRR